MIDYTENISFFVRISWNIGIEGIFLFCFLLIRTLPCQIVLFIKIFLIKQVDFLGTEACNGLTLWFFLFNQNNFTYNISIFSFFEIVVKNILQGYTTFSQFGIFSWYIFKFTFLGNIPSKDIISLTSTVIFGSFILWHCRQVNGSNISIPKKWVIYSDMNHDVNSS